MAVVNKKGTAVTAADTLPPANGQFVNTRISGGRIKESVGVVAVANGDSTGSTLRVARISSGDRVSRVLVSCTAITDAAANIGLYDTDVNGGAAVDATFFASAQSLAAALAGTDVTHGGTFGVAKAEQLVWQVLGLTSDPGKLYDVTFTLTAGATADGALAVKVHVVDGN